MTAEIVTLIISVILSAASLAGYVKAQITQLEKRIDELSDVRERLARIEAKIDHIKHA